MSHPVSADASGGTLALSWTCAACGEANASRPAGDGVACDSCGTAVAVEEPHRQFRQCAVCSSTRLYRQRDFSRFLGLAVVVVGAVLVPFTYGLSLPVVFLIDLILYRRVADMAVCYLCRAEYRGAAVPKRILPFRHHLAAGYEKRRERWLEQTGRSSGHG